MVQRDLARWSEPITSFHLEFIVGHKVPIIGRMTIGWYVVVSGGFRVQANELLAFSKIT